MTAKIHMWLLSTLIYIYLRQDLPIAPLASLDLTEIHLLLPPEHWDQKTHLTTPGYLTYFVRGRCALAMIHVWRSEDNLR